MDKKPICFKNQKPGPIARFCSDVITEKKSAAAAKMIGTVRAEDEDKTLDVPVLFINLDQLVTEWYSARDTV